MLSFLYMIVNYTSIYQMLRWDICIKMKAKVQDALKAVESENEPEELSLGKVALLLRTR